MDTCNCNFFESNTPYLDQFVEFRFISIILECGQILTSKRFQNKFKSFKLLLYMFRSDFLSDMSFLKTIFRSLSEY